MSMGYRLALGIVEVLRRHTDKQTVEAIIDDWPTIKGEPRWFRNLRNEIALVAVSLDMLDEYVEQGIEMPGGAVEVLEEAGMLDGYAEEP
jgi:hypothetical protein